MDGFVLSAFSGGTCDYQFRYENVRFSLHLDSGLFQSEDANQYTNEAMHRHPYYEWFFVTNGSMRLVTAVQSLVLHKNDFVIIQPGAEHCVHFLEDGTTRYNLNFSFEAANARENGELYAALTALLEKNPCLAGSGSEELAEVNKHLSQLCGTNRRGMICACFIELMTCVLDLTGGTPTLPALETLLGGPEVSRTEKLRRVFDSYYMYDLSLEYVARCIGVSTRQLGRIVRQTYGCTYHERLSYMRICSARQLLSRTDYTVREIARWVGYQSLGGFYTAFKAQCGCLPTEYRRGDAASSEQKTAPDADRLCEEEKET